MVFTMTLDAHGFHVRRCVRSVSSTPLVGSSNSRRSLSEGSMTTIPSPGATFSSSSSPSVAWCKLVHRYRRRRSQIETDDPTPGVSCSQCCCSRICCRTSNLQSGHLDCLSVNQGRMQSENECVREARSQKWDGEDEKLVYHRADECSTIFPTVAESAAYQCERRDDKARQ